MCEARRFMNLFVAVFFFLLGSAAAQETRFFLPILYGSGADLGLALSNPTAAEAAVTLTARDYSGSVIAGSQITNPVTVRVPASGQRSRRMAEIFGAGIVGKSGWTELAASSPEIKGFFVTFDSALTFIDGAELQNRPSRRLTFQNVTAFSSTASAVTFVNTTADTLSNVVFKVYSPTGLTGTKVFEMAPYSGFSGAVTDFIPRVSVAEPGLPGFDRGYATLEVGGSTGSVDALVGFETYRRTGDLAAMNAATDASRLRAGYLPHFATGSGYRTTLHL